jgi:uncharacterized DUF497 family protein
MILEWDTAKNLSNIQKHGFDFAEAEELFRGLLVVDPDTREDYGEKRWTGIRIISLRKATRREQKQYEEAIQDRLGQD